jgi:hypothetical protein
MNLLLFDASETSLGLFFFKGIFDGEFDEAMRSLLDGLS